MSLANSIKLIRQEALLSQEQFADELNVGITTVNRWECGKSIPSISKMKNLQAFCENKGISYEAVKNAWLEARMRASI